MEHFEGPLLVLAGAGSGKTRVLTTRACHLVMEHGVPPERILAVTFTNKAAAEMRERIRRMLDSEPAGMWLGTFHALGARLLRRHAERLGWTSQFSIFDADQSLRQVKRTQEALGIDSRRWSPQAVRAHLSAAKNRLVSPEGFARDNEGSFDLFARVVARVYPEYQAALRDQNAFDFDDLLLKPVELLEAEPDLLERYRRRFAFILVDEYQDTNRAQFRFLELLAAGHKNLMVVGDDDQCVLPQTPVAVPGGTLAAGDVPVGAAVTGLGVGGAAEEDRVDHVFRRSWSGPAILLETTSGARLACTPNHLLFVRPRTEPDRWYLWLREEEGPAFRVGAARGSGGAGPGPWVPDAPHPRGVRPSGSRGWLLGSASSEVEARRLEARVSSAYGIPAEAPPVAGLPRRAGPAPSAFGRRLDPFEPAERLLEDLMLFREYPHGSSGVEGAERTTAEVPGGFRLQPASHVLEGMEVPTLSPGGLVRAERVLRREVFAYDGPVVDLSVPGLRNYFAGGICVHNSIYRWRGADIRNILDFEETFPGARVVRLERNYRSSATILDTANAVIAENRERKGKTLRTDRAPGEAVTLVETADENDEARWVVEEIEARYRDGPALHNYRDFAVLYRTNAQARALEDGFRRRGVPYQIVGGVRFYERREIQDVLAYLRLVSNPLDETAFERVVNYPRRGVGDKTVEGLRAFAEVEGLGLLEAAARAGEADVPSAGARGLERFARLVRRYSGMAATTRVGMLLEQLVEELDLLRLLADEGPDGEDRAENVRELIASAMDFDAELLEDVEAGDVDTFTELDLFLQRVALVADIDRHDPDADAVTLMTLHNAKGLEFPVVFLTGLEDGLFPLLRAYDEPAALEEERRLFYVGVTRAEDKLYLLHAHQRRRAGEFMHGRLSPFVDAVPEPLLERRRSPLARLDAEGTPRWRRAGEGHRRERDPWDEDASLDQDAPRFVKGERVLHPTFGSGTIREISGFGPDMKVTVDFELVGRKKLVVRYAQLARDFDV